MLKYFTLFQNTLDGFANESLLTIVISIGNVISR